MAVGVAFVGCTHPHLFPRIEILSGASDVELVGCYDPDAGLTAALQERHGLPAYPSAEALLDDDRVTFAIIEGWDPDNPGYVRQAAERGKAILLEKPGAPNLEGMRQVVDVVRAADVPFQVGYMLRHSSAIRRGRELLASGVLGEVTLARFHAAAPVGGAREVWQSVPGDLGGLIYTDGCHMVDLVVHLLGAPRRVKGALLHLPAGAPVLAHGFKEHTLSGLYDTVEMPIGGLVHEDVGMALFEYDRMLATFDITGWEAHPWVEAWRIEIYGTDGTLHLGPSPASTRLYVRNATAEHQPGWHSWESLDSFGVAASLVVDEMYTGEIDHMLDRVRRWDTANERWLADAEAVVATLDAIYGSAREDAPRAPQLR